MVQFFRHVLSSLLVLAMVSSLPKALSNETDPSVRERKGDTPSEATWLDREHYADGSLYENPPTEVRTVRIGISYDDSAVMEAYIRNTSGNGFRIGIYNNQREFVERVRTDADDLIVTWADDEDNGLMILGEDATDVLYLSGSEESLALEPIFGEIAYGVNTYCGGFECRKAPERTMTVINCVELETYVKGVVPYEMATDWPMEALKAQAVCARTYVVYNQNAFSEFGFDLTDNTESQVYRGTTWATPWTDAAVDSTAGELIRYEGELCEIYYFAADGGATEDGQYVFDSARPYLLGKRDPFEQSVDFAYRSWTRSYSGEELAERMLRRDFPFEPIQSIELERSALGNVIAVTYVGRSGAKLRLEGRDCYNAIGLPDCRFSVYWDDGRFHFKGSGLGHSCGLSQWGAKAMDEIYGYSYDDIIRFYYTGAYIA